MMVANTSVSKILEQKAEKIEATFLRIYQERMHDIAIVNKNIHVHVIGLQVWQQSYLGVLITPWFMSLLLLPAEDENWQEKTELSSSNYQFPSGKYQFLTAYEQEIGKYQTCSLFSPMFEFSSDELAIETAQAVLQELMKEENKDDSYTFAQEIENSWNGNTTISNASTTVNENNSHLSVDSNATLKDETLPHSSIEDALNRPVSRRKLLRSAMMLDDETVKETKK